ncbi:MAG: glutathione S-transferase [Pseudomonadota bacterium]
MELPVFYSFRRCPYAMRARLALVASGVPVALREVVLRDKPDAFLDASPSRTVPCLVTATEVIDESLDIMVWALRQNDPQGWLAMPQDGWDWITRCDGPFKAALDRTKYATRYPEADQSREREKAAAFLRDLEAQLESATFAAPSLAGFAILPFVRQFAFIDKDWFDAQPWPRLKARLDVFLASDAFSEIMPKYVQWRPGDPNVRFPPAGHVFAQTR